MTKPKTPVAPPVDQQALVEMVAEMRQFSSRIMTGYEAAHRTIAEMAEMMSKSAAESQAATVKAIRMQIELADEHEELRSKRHKRELEAKSEEASRASRQALMNDGRVVLTLAVKKMLGIPLTGNDSHGLQDLLASMSTDQLDSIMTTGTVQLTDAQRQALIMTVSALGESEAKKNGESAALPEAAE